MKKMIFFIISSLILMIGFPFCAVTFAGGAGMGICFILFYAVNPLFSAVCGVFAGIGRLWWLPLINALLFLAGTWIFFDMGETDFLFYCGFYLIIGIIAMLISALVKRISK